MEQVAIMHETVIDKVVELRDQRDSEDKCVIGMIRNDGEEGKVGDLAFVKVSRKRIETRMTVPRQDCIFLSSGICFEQAALLPHLVFSLWAWDQLSLELGDTALFTGSGQISKVVCQVAYWKSALPIVSIEPLEGCAPTIKYPEVKINDGETLLLWLKELLNGLGGFAAIDMDGRDWIVNTILEVAPKWGRLMLAGEKNEFITIDYYKNIHRKGVHILTTQFQPTIIFRDDKIPNIKVYLRRALRIFQNQKMTKDLLAAVGNGI